jgi:poly-gamma-glutamate synthesis protein (capsule biosynthesis protein)
MRADPALVNDLVWFGFDMVSRANNHAGDYGVPAMLLTTKYVARAGLVQAGVGTSLEEARAAAFYDSPTGRVALISAASTFPDHIRASHSRGDMPARPGLNPLRFSRTYVVTREQLEQLRATFRALGFRVPEQGDSIRVLNNQFVPGDKPAVRTAPNKADIDGMAAVVSNARRLADYTIVSIHAHEGGRTRTEPAEFLVSFAHAMIDAGATLVVGHGPHVLGGIEFYKGRPIFYSLGDLIFENDTVERLPQENYEPYNLGPLAHVADFDEARSGGGQRGFVADREIWESVLALPRWSEGTLAEITLYPITLGFGQPLTVRGRPKLAEGDLARKILEDIVQRSAPFGTTISVDHGVGRVMIPSASAEDSRAARPGAGEPGTGTSVR